MTAPAYELQAPALGDWRRGNTGVEGVWQFSAALPGPCVLVSALVHGNELCGAWVLKELLASGLRPTRGVLTLAFCNLEAFDSFDPGQPDAARFVDEDLNRQWSQCRLAQPSTSERRRAAQLRRFVEASDFLLDLHSMHEPGPPLFLPGPHPRNVLLAQALGSARHIVVDEGHADGVRMRDFGPFGLPDGAPGAGRALLVECGFHGDLAALAVARDACARFLCVSGAVDAQAVQARLPGWRSLPEVEPQVLAVEGAAVARGRHVEFFVPLSSVIHVPEAGTLVADNAGEEVRTPFDDCVLVMPSARQARAGVTVVRFARRVPAPAAVPG